MSTNKARYPGPGCVVEVMQGNTPMQALVLEEQGGRLRLYGSNRRESNITAARLLPWSGPAVGSGLSRQRMDEILEERKNLRAGIAADLSPLDIWELTQGEVAKASAEWLAGLLWEQPDIDQEAALGHRLLLAKTHFRFSPPDFEIFPQSIVEARLAEAENTRAREAFAVTGAQFFQRLWDIYCHKRPPLTPAELPEPELAEKCKELLFAHLIDPETTEHAASWKLLVKSLPESPHTPLCLAIAWGLVPEHYNFWLDRAGFVRGEDWAKAWPADCTHVQTRTAELLQALQSGTAPRPASDEEDQELARGREGPYAALYTDTAELPFVSVDPISTKDRDDAFYVEKHADGEFSAHIALACPSRGWPFGSELDKEVMRRGSSLYLPEGDEHMLPASLGRSLFSLDAEADRPGLVLSMRLSSSGEVLACNPRLGLVRMADNLDLESCERLLGNDSLTAAVSGEQLAQWQERHGGMLGVALELARILQTRRVAAGAVITERPDPTIEVQGEGEDARVTITDGPHAPAAHLIVGELMVLTNSCLASWAGERHIPVLYRTQDVALPREFAGVWTEPHDISRIVRFLPPAALECSPRRHAGLGLAVYATFSSPIRRYVDLLNQEQLLSFLYDGAPRLNMEELQALLPLLSTHLDAVSQIQRFRPRYWKLQFFRQQGDKKWWDGVVAEENEAFATIALPWAQLMVRGRRRQFDEKLYPGMQVQVRLGKVQPLANEIQILEVREA